MTDTTTERPTREQQRADAEAARDEGLERAEQAADPRIILAIDDEIQRAVDSGRRFSANDIRDKFPVSDEHLVGQRIRSFAVRHVDGHPVMKRVAYEPSTLRSTHNHPIAVWLGWNAHQLAYRNQSTQPTT